MTAFLKIWHRWTCRWRLNLFIINSECLMFVFCFPTLFITFLYILYKKNWNCENFRLTVFDGFTLFGMSWTRFHYFYKMSVHKFCGLASAKSNRRISMKFYIQLISSWVTFVTNFFVTYTQTGWQTDRHFPEAVISCSRHPKKCKSIKNRE